MNKDKYKKTVLMFEAAAIKKGYCFDRDEFGKYEDIYLQEAWEIFCLIDLNGLETEDN